MLHLRSLLYCYIISGNDGERHGDRQTMAPDHIHTFSAWNYCLIPPAVVVARFVALLGSIHTCYLLGVNYYMNYSLNNGWYCTKVPFTPAIY